MERQRFAAIVLALSVPAAAPGGRAAEGPGFATAPVAAKTQAGWTVRFEVDRPTDVEVAVLGPTGRVVRHLAAGVLGGRHTPPPPLKPGLKQAIVWDGKDDLAEAVARPAACRVRVRLGMGVKLDGFIGENRTHAAALWGLATDDDGNVYVYSASVGNKGPGASHQMQVFDRGGKYLRTIMPMPANISRDRIGPFKTVPGPGEFLYPRNRWGTWPVLYPDLSIAHALGPRVGKDGALVLSDGRRTARIATDGGAVGGVFARENWPAQARPHPTIDRWFMNYPGYVALSPDTKGIYVAGVFQRKATQQLPMTFPPDRIYRVKSEGGGGEVFATVRPEGDAKVELAGMAFDPKGNLLVCDRGGNRIVVLDPQGKQIGAVPAPSPAYVACHRRTGAIYVTAGRGTPQRSYYVRKTLLKLAPWADGGRELARLKLREAGLKAVLALDDSADPAVVWVGIDRSKAGDAYNPDKPARILRLEDRGGTFAATDHDIQVARREVCVVTRLAVHPETDQIVCRGEYAAAEGFDGLTGKPIKLPFDHCVDMGVGLDGRWYIQPGWTWAGWLLRFDRDFKPVPVPGAPARVDGKGQKRPAHAVGWAFGRYGEGFGTAGVTADARGRIISMQQVDHQTISGDCVVVFGADGGPEDPGRMKGDERIARHGRFPSALVGPIAARVGGVAVDYAGCVYVGVQLQPLDHKPPKGFATDPAYLAVVGSVVKMKPEGGSIIDLGGEDARPPRKARPVPAGMTGLKLARRGGYPRGTMFVENAVRAYPGLASVSGNFGTGCRCRQPMFQVDGWGRLFIPNAITYSVAVVDNAGNGILRFGHYGNVDSAGPGSAVPVPEVPLGWPEAVGVSRRAIYVADVLNRRIVRLRRTWAQELTVPLQ